MAANATESDASRAASPPPVFVSPISTLVRESQSPWAPVGRAAIPVDAVTTDPPVTDSWDDHDAWDHPEPSMVAEPLDLPGEDTSVDEQAEPTDETPAKPLLLRFRRHTKQATEVHEETIGKPAKTRRWWRPLVDFAVIFVVAVLVCVLIKAVAFRTFEVPSESMTPTLAVHDRILVELITPHFAGYQRGDVVVFKDTADWIGDGTGKDGATDFFQLLGLVPEPTGFIVKRVLAVPGETIEGLADGTLLVNGEELNDPYADRAEQRPFTWTLSAGEYWMMGDNRPGSADSRMHGPVKQEELVGRVVFRFFPFERFGSIELTRE